MKTKLKLILPTAQVAIAVFLLAYGNAQRRSSRFQDISYGPPATRICYALNPPAVLFRSAGLYLWGRLGLPWGDSPNSIDNGVFIFGVGLTWYLVGVAIESRWKKRGVISVAPKGVRRLIRDSALLILGAAFILLGMGAWTLVHWGAPGQAASETALYAIWGFVLLIVYGRDLLRSISIPSS